MATARRLRERVPTFLQMEATECGAACLGMVMARYGRFQPLEELRITCGVARDGATARGIVQAARSYGMKTRAFTRDPDTLKDLQFPIVVHWRFAHFLVVEGWHPGGWYLNDPASGPRRCTDSEFDESFTGVAIELVPGDAFVAQGRRPGVIGRLIAAAGHVRPFLAVSALLGLLLLIPTLLVPSIVRLFGNGLAGEPSIEIGEAAAGLLVAVALQFGLLWLQGSLSVRLASKVSIRLNASMLHRLLRLPMAYHAQRGANSLAQRAFLAGALSTSVSAIAITALTGVLTSFVACLVLLAQDWWCGVLALAIGVATAASLRQAMVRSRDVAAQVVHEFIAVGAVMSSSLSQIEAMKSAGLEDGVIARGFAAENRLLAAQQRIGERSLGLMLIPSVLSGTGTLLIAALAVWQVNQGSLAPGSFLAVLALASFVIAPLGQVAVALEQAQTLRATLDQVDDVMGAAEDPGVRPIAPGPVITAGDVRMEAVTFGYNPVGVPLITDFSLHLEPGKRVALVGPSGCGKSTISRLVTGLYSPWSGQILIDGHPRAEIPREVLTDRIALVDQDVTVFSGTIRDNVTLWDPTLSDHDVLAALADAELADLVSSRSGGLDALIAEDGADLSGGQRQRIEIARALVRNPAIIVMDEATSSLDPITELAIDEAIRRRGSSCIVIAHRLSTIRDSDEILMLNDGAVVERGTHDSLMALGGEYARLVVTQ